MITKNSLTKALFFSLMVSIAACGPKKDGETAATEGTESESGVDMSSFKEAKGTTNDYSMMLPDYLTPASNLNDDASLQYQNIYKETYIVVIDESKEEFISTFKELGTYDSTQSALKNYRQSQINFFKETALSMKPGSEPKAVKINGLDAEMMDFEAKVEGVESDIYYNVAFIEGKEKMYWVMAWTMPTSKDKYKPDFEAAMKTFKEIGGGSSGAKASR
jgi:hypothetical protein